MAKTKIGKRIIRIIDQAEKLVKAGQELKKSLEELKEEDKKEPT